MFLFIFPKNLFIFVFKVYLSDFGEERMAEEEATGPKELKEIAENLSENDDDNNEENIEVCCLFT